ncbi:putative LRR receptor-like serine/threonine-protein kinase At1g51860 [Carex rostrata]
MPPLEILKPSQAVLDELLLNRCYPSFISIDCGRAENSNFNVSYYNLPFVSDDQFIDTGENKEINSRFATSVLFKAYLTVRSFPHGIRNCYSLPSKIGSKYIIRGFFMYGNYDQLNKFPTFDVHLGVNYMDTVKITNVTGPLMTEIIATATSDYVEYCLVNTNQGTPFISVLELRPLPTRIYQLANSTQSLVTYQRSNLGETDLLRRWIRNREGQVFNIFFSSQPVVYMVITFFFHRFVGYPDDPYNRYWYPYMEETWIDVSTKVNLDIDFETPSRVMQTAVTTLNTTQPLYLNWTSEYDVTVFLLILHFSEIENISSTEHREFNIYINKILFGNWSRSSTTSALTYSVWDNTEYNLYLKATSSSTLPPLMNAFEVYAITPAIGIPTNSEDGIYLINPCVPKEFLWTGVNCTLDSTHIPRITTLNLSSSGLTGPIVASFGNLSALQILDLSNNDLSGDLPVFLDKLSSLRYLDITGNDKISTTLPPGLQNRKQGGNLTFMFGRAGPLPAPTRNRTVIIAVAGVVVMLLIAAAIIIVVYVRRRKDVHSEVPEQLEISRTTPNLAYNHQPNYANTPQGNIAGQNYTNVSKPNEAGEGLLDFENRRFSYNDLSRITNKFLNNIGSGGFGRVYVGALENGTQVAVKMQSHTSSQGMKEFLAEAQNLTRVHHRNLVSLIGYCMDGDSMALVYEYMQEKLMGDYNARPLSWKQRVRIAYESALGLKYLHKACNPPLIHRDVKTSNILLNSNLEAKNADFGLSRAFNNGVSSHVSTAIVGTPGYLDPEYYSSYQLSEKSDVFSFGVVLLEIITGQPPIIVGPEGGHLKQWVDQKLSRGDIESIVDQRIHGQYDINSVWKVTDLAHKCTGPNSAQRPTMSVVVAELKESLDLEISTEGTRSGSTTYTNPHNNSRNDNFVSDVSQNSVFEMAYMGGTGRSATAPIAR